MAGARHDRETAWARHGHGMLCANRPLNTHRNLAPCCVLRGPGEERIVDIVPGGRQLELQVKTGSWAGRKHLQ